MKSKLKKIILLFIGLVIAFSLNNTLNNNKGAQNELSIPKQSAGYSESFIHVDGNWTQTASTYDWCYGDGSWSTPYIIENVTIDASSSPTGSGIFIDNSKNDYFIIRNCTVNYASLAYSNAGIKLTNTNNGTITTNTVSDNNGRGILLRDGCDNNTISENLVYDNGDQGISLEKDCNYNKILNNTANHNNLGITIYGNPGSGYNRIINNTANDNSERGIYITNGCHYNNITGNIANNNGKEGIFLEGQSDFNNIINNTANHNGDRGIVVFNGCDDNTIANNAADDNEESGIFFYNSDSNKILNNTANNNGEAGIWLDINNFNNNITGNIVNDNIQIGIYLTQSNGNNIKNNTINRNNLGIGFKVSNSNTVLDNSLMDNGVCIFEFGCTGNIIENNTCSGSFKPLPIFIDGTATGVGAHNWTWVEQQSWFGGGLGTKNFPYIIEDLERDGLTITSCIEIINSNVYFIVRNCTFYNSGSAGITLDNVSNGTLTKNNCSFNHIGISLDSDSDFNNITGNTANSNDQNGISLGNNCDFNNIVGNIANNNTHHGIYLDDHCDNNTISQNTASYNGNTGIYLFGGGGPGSCYNNTISGNTANDNNYGIRLEGACHFNQILGNTIKDNNFGISLEDSECSNNSLYNNLFLKNEKHATDYGTDNNWNSTIIGNYWDNHTVPDTTPQDGIVDIQYNISGSAGSIDYLPIAEDGTPTIVVNSPDPGDLFNSSAPSFNVRIADDYLDEMWYTLDGGLHNYTFANNSTIDQSAWIALSDGTITLTFYASDIPGNIGSADVNIIKDTQTPIITVNSPEDDDIFGSSAPSFNVRITDDNIDTMWYTLDGGLHNYTFTDNGTINPTPWAALLDGPVEIIFYANDTLGHLVSAEVNVIKDTQTPAITVNSPEDDDIFGVSAPSFNVRITDDNIDSMWYSLDGGLHNYTFTDNGTINPTPWAALLDGPVEIIFYANDTLGRLASAGVNIVKDATGPIIVITSPVDDEEFGTQAPLFNITITDDHLDSIWYSLDGGVTTYVITTNATINQTAWTALSEGSITITFYANDTLGHETSEDVIITKSIPPAGDDPTIVIVIIVVSIVGGVAVLAGVYLFMKKRGITE